MSIRLEHISKTFNGFKALENINVDFADGELTALLGPSGSGKTTLLRLVAGLEVPDDNPECRILFNDVDVMRQSVGQRMVGFVFQHYALFRHLSVFENIAFGLRVKKKEDRPSKREIQDRVFELLKLIQLDNMHNRLPSQLSGGQRQRVALARALAIQPKVLLLDEPFGSLDAKVRNELRKWLRQLHDRLHFTSIFVTHDQEEALEVADRIVLTNNGKIEQIGTPEEVFHNPANEFVMRFLGEVNVFHGRIDETDRFRTQDEQSEDTGDASLMIRPHDFIIHLHDQEKITQIPAIVRKIQTAGAIVKIELEDTDHKSILVHQSHEEFRTINIQIQQQVFLTPRELKVYSNGKRWDKKY
ncbi:TOBE-like domain-containing protein [bacterium]|nr:TOBE-like domain-containing protein [bacterium]